LISLAANPYSSFRGRFSPQESLSLLGFPCNAAAPLDDCPAASPDRSPRPERIERSAVHQLRTRHPARSVSASCWRVGQRLRQDLSSTNTLFVGAPTRDAFGFYFPRLSSGRLLRRSALGPVLAFVTASFPWSSWDSLPWGRRSILAINISATLGLQPLRNPIFFLPIS
jgi:hypothetical protein